MNFSTATKENLEQKIEASSANRETLILDMKTKLSSHVRKINFQYVLNSSKVIISTHLFFFFKNTNHLQEVRQNLMTNLTEFEEKAKAEIALKLEAAEKNREKVIQEKIESLKKHVRVLFRFISFWQLLFVTILISTLSTYTGWEGWADSNQTQLKFSFRRRGATRSYRRDPQPTATLTKHGFPFCHCHCHSDYKHKPFSLQTWASVQNCPL